MRFVFSDAYNNAYAHCPSLRGARSLAAWTLRVESEVVFEKVEAARIHDGLDARGSWQVDHSGNGKKCVLIIERECDRQH
jgi:hypothetical protein